MRTTQAARYARWSAAVALLLATAGVQRVCAARLAGASGAPVDASFGSRERAAANRRIFPLESHGRSHRVHRARFSRHRIHRRRPKPCSKTFGSRHTGRMGSASTICTPARATTCSRPATSLATATCKSICRAPRTPSCTRARRRAPIPARKSCTSTPAASPSIAARAWPPPINP